MEKLAAYFALKIEGLMMRTHLIGQKLVSYREVNAMFGGGDYPEDVWRVFGRIDERTTREDVVAALRDIANRNARGAIFAQAVQ